MDSAGSDSQGIYPVTPFAALASCFCLASFFVGSLYVWKPYTAQERDVPANVMRRFASVSVAMAISPLLVFYLLQPIEQRSFGVLQLMGLRAVGFVPAVLLPTTLTAVLFAGPLYVQYLHNELQPKAGWPYWSYCFADIVWIRNHVIAPVSEEFTFRACMMPLLLHAFRPGTAILLTPLFFGIAHLHHAIERYRSGMPLLQIAIVCTVQFAYTSVFGIYSAYLFARTGHYVAAVAAHAFCNHMGVPHFEDVLNEPNPRQKHRMIGAYCLGVVAWWLLLPVLTQPEVYGNTMYGH